MKETQDESKLVPLYKPANEAEFVVISSLLDDGEIPFLAKNKNLQNLFGMGSMGTGFSVVTGEITIFVHEDDFEEGQELLKRYMEIHHGDLTPEAVPEIEALELLKSDVNKYLNFSIVIGLFIPGFGIYHFFKALLIKLANPDKKIGFNLKLIVSFIIALTGLFVATLIFSKEL